MPIESQHEKQWLYCYANKIEEKGSQQARGEPGSRCLGIRWNTLLSAEYYVSVFGSDRDWVSGGFAREQFDSPENFSIRSMCICRSLSQK